MKDSVQARVRVAIYARVSTDQQAEAQTIASQLAVLRARVVQDGYTLADRFCFVDDGYSGMSLARPALERLRDLAACGGLDRLYVLDPDRLARKYAYGAILLEELQRAGVEVVFINGKPGHTPEDQLLVQVQGVVA
jgi:site-specific DNA recombinase